MQQMPGRHAPLTSPEDRPAKTPSRCACCRASWCESTACGPREVHVPGWPVRLLRWEAVSLRARSSQSTVTLRARRDPATRPVTRCHTPLRVELASLVSLSLATPAADDIDNV